MFSQIYYSFLPHPPFSHFSPGPEHQSMVCLPVNSATLLLRGREQSKQCLCQQKALTEGGDLSLPAHQWNLPSVTPIVTHASAKAPHSYLVPQAFPLWRIPNIVPKFNSCVVPASTTQCSCQCSAPVCSRKTSVLVLGSLGPRIWTALGHASVTRNAASAACVLRGGIYLL